MFSEVRNFQDALYPNGHPCRFEFSATQIRSRADAKHPELQFRALLTEGVPTSSRLSLGAREEGRLLYHLGDESSSAGFLKVIRIRKHKSS